MGNLTNPSLLLRNPIHWNCYTLNGIGIGSSSQRIDSKVSIREDTPSENIGLWRLPKMSKSLRFLKQCNHVHSELLPCFLRQALFYGYNFFLGCPRWILTRSLKCIPNCISMQQKTTHGNCTPVWWKIHDTK